MTSNFEPLSGMLSKWSKGERLSQHAPSRRKGSKRAKSSDALDICQSPANPSLGHEEAALEEGFGLSKDRREPKLGGDREGPLDRSHDDFRVREHAGEGTRLPSRKDRSDGRNMDAPSKEIVRGKTGSSEESRLDSRTLHNLQNLLTRNTLVYKAASGTPHELASQDLRDGGRSLPRHDSASNLERDVLGYGLARSDEARLNDIGPVLGGEPNAPSSRVKRTKTCHTSEWSLLEESTLELAGGELTLDRLNRTDRSSPEPTLREDQGPSQHFVGTGLYMELAASTRHLEERAKLGLSQLPSPVYLSEV
ncbi:MAG: hypothetical protein GTN93_15325, partial [Anaerolineae bacterium]|nr:hypothetical protein [Anaerolineae bacterium]